MYSPKVTYLSPKQENPYFTFSFNVLRTHIRSNKEFSGNPYLIYVVFSVCNIKTSKTQFTSKLLVQNLIFSIKFKYIKNATNISCV